MFKIEMMSVGRAFGKTVVVLSIALLSACGGGGSVDVGVAVPIQPDPGPVVVAVAPLSLALTRVGPNAIAVDWSDDPLVDTFYVIRDGVTIASVSSTTTLIDNSVFVDETYCYSVEGDSPSGLLVAASSVGCISVVP